MVSNDGILLSRTKTKIQNDMPKENYRFPGPGLPDDHIKVYVNSLDDFFKAATEMAVIGKKCTSNTKKTGKILSLHGK